MRFGLSLIAGAVLLAGHAAAADWKLLTFPEQGFAIESPLPLMKGSGTYQATGAGRIPTVTYTGELDKIRYSVTVIDISNRPAETLNLFEEMESVLESQGKVLGNDSMGIGPGKGRQFGRQLLIQAKDGSLRRIGLMYNNGKLYQLEGTVLSSGDMQSIFPERFSDSILFDLDLKRMEERSSNPDNFRADPTVGKN